MTAILVKLVQKVNKRPKGLQSRKATPLVTYVCPALDPPLGSYDRIPLTDVCGHEHFFPTKFREHPLSGSVVKADYVFPYIYMH